MRIEIDPEEFAPIIEAAVAKAIAAFATASEKVPQKELYTEQEAAGWIGLSTKRLSEMRKEGKIISCRVGRNRVRYRREDLIAYLAERRGDG